MISKLKQIWKEQPMIIIMIIAFVPRLLAAIFSRGYGMHDDHFVFVEMPYRILNDISLWENREFQQGRSVVYPALHYFLFQLCNIVGLHDPQDKMLLVRLIHSLYSLIAVFFGYKIALKIASPSTAKTVGLLLALFWLLPFMSVRDMAEMASIPPLMAGLYYSIRNNKRKDFLFSGIFFGLAFVFRIQTLVLPITVFFILFFRKQYKESMILLIACIVTMLIFEGIPDWLVWGYPFAPFLKINFINAISDTDYVVGPWYRYILLLTGLLIPPVSILFIFGFFRNWKNNLMLFLPVLMFLVAHSYITNKQERFILPILPAFILLAVVGWKEFENKSSFFIRHKNIKKSIWIWFWSVNIVLLLLFSLTYSKKTRVESMYYFYKKENVSAVLVLGVNNSTIQPPTFYMHRPEIPVYSVVGNYTVEDMENINKQEIAPNYIVFFGKELIEERVSKLENDMSFKLVFEKEIEPSFIDDLLFKLNPRGNKNQSGLIYKALPMRE